MKILYAIQGTGNGHLSRARDIYPELCKYGTVDILVSGIQADVVLPFPVKYKYYGMSFIFGHHGQVAIWDTIKKLRPVRFIKDSLNVPVQTYDLVINDFEAITAWACKRRRIPCISLSHQWAVQQEKSPRPNKIDGFGEWVLKHYAPCTDGIGFHFKAFDKKIFTPVIRQEVRDLQASNQGHITVYLPAYDDETLIRHLSTFKEVKWQIFSKHNTEAITKDHLSIQPISNTAFLNSMATSSGVLCGAGFEGPAEALFLGKKLMVIPMGNQYEQQCNAAALQTLGVPVLRSLSHKYYDRIHHWLGTRSTTIQVNYPDETASIIKGLMTNYTRKAKSTNG